jgi:hypothetical protein
MCVCSRPSHPFTCRSAATSSRRDIKKALQHFARKRPDIVLQLPAQLLADLSSADFPELLEKKARTALLRLKAGAGPGAAAKQAAFGPLAGRASTQDVLRVMWALVDTSTADDDTAAETTATNSSDLYAANAGGSCGVHKSGVQVLLSCTYLRQSP